MDEADIFTRKFLACFRILGYLCWFLDFLFCNDFSHNFGFYFFRLRFFFQMKRVEKKKILNILSASWFEKIIHTQYMNLTASA